MAERQQQKPRALRRAGEGADRPQAPGAASPLHLQAGTSSYILLGSIFDYQPANTIKDRWKAISTLYLIMAWLQLPAGKKQ